MNLFSKDSTATLERINCTTAPMVTNISIRNKGSVLSHQMFNSLVRRAKARDNCHNITRFIEQMGVRDGTEQISHLQILLEAQLQRPHRHGSIHVHEVAYLVGR
jgi:hypothetical protein